MQAESVNMPTPYFNVAATNLCSAVLFQTEVWCTTLYDLTLWVNCI